MCGRLLTLPDSLLAVLSRFPQQIGQALSTADWQTGITARIGKYSVNGILSDIPSSGIFRVSVTNWLCASVSLRRSRNIKAKATEASKGAMAGSLAFRLRTAEYTGAIRSSVLDCKACRATQVRRFDGS
jgi:hypothetical protein